MKHTIDVPEGHFLAWVAIPFRSLSLDPKYPAFYQVAFGSYRGECIGSKGVKPCIVKKSKDKKDAVAARFMVPTSTEMAAREVAEETFQDLGF